MASPKVIGEGTYGCVLKPSLTCKDKKIILNYNDKISKIMMNKHAQTEMKDYVGINMIDPDNKYHLAPQECIPENSKKNKTSVINCKEGKDMVKKMNKYKLIVMKFGGPDLYNFFYTPLEDTPNNIKRISDFWKEAVNLFKAVQLFIQNGMIHHDFKPENIVYDESKGSLKVIDFGLLQTKNKIIQDSNNGNYWLSMYHFNFPPEMFLYNKKKLFDNKHHALSFTGSIEDDYKKSLETMMYHYVKNEELYPQLKEDITKDFLNFMKDVTTDKIKFNDLLVNSIETIDVYGLGMSLLYVLKHTYKLMKHITVIRLKHLLIHMIHPDFRKRIRIDDALTQYKIIMKIPTTPIVRTIVQPQKLPSHPSSLLPDGLTRKVGKKCPNGSKTYKYKDKNVCKKHNISVKIPRPPLGLEPVIESSLPKNMIYKTGKRCPNGSKTHTYNNRIVCLKNI